MSAHTVWHGSSAVFISDDFEEGLRTFSVRGLTNLVPLSVPREKLFVYSGDVDFNMQYYVNGIFSSEADIEQFPD